MIIGNVYAKLKNSGNPTLPLLNNEIEELYVPLADKDVDGNVLGMVFRAQLSVMMNSIAQYLYHRYSTPRFLNSNEKVKKLFGLYFDNSAIGLKKLSSNEAREFVSTYVPSSKLWAAIGDEYERVKPAPMGKTVTDNTVGLPSTDNKTWDKTFEVGDKVKVRMDMVANAQLPSYDAPENEFEVTKVEVVDIIKRPENLSGRSYTLSNGQVWEGKDLEQSGVKIIQPPVIPSIKYRIIGWADKEEYVDYKTGQGTNVQPYAVGVNFDDIIAYTNGIANSKLGLDQIYFGNDVKDTFVETIKNFFLNNVEVSSWSVNSVKPYNLVIYKPEKPEITAAALAEYTPPKSEIAQIKKVLGSEVDDEFASKVAAMDWKKISGLKKRNPEIFAKFVETLAAIFEDYKVEQGIDENIVEAIAFSSPDLVEKFAKYQAFDDAKLNGVNIVAFDNNKTSDQVTYYEFEVSTSSPIYDLVKNAVNAVGGYSLQQILAGETNDYTFRVTATRILKGMTSNWSDEKVVVGVPSYKDSEFEKLVVEEAAKSGVTEKPKMPTPIPQPEPEPETQPEPEDLSQYTEEPLSWYTKIELEDFGYDKVQSLSEIKELLTKKRRSVEDKIKLVLLVGDVYQISPYDEKYGDFVKLYKMLYPTNANNIDGKQNFKFILKDNLKLYFPTYEESFGRYGLLQFAPANISVSEWIIGLPFDITILDIEKNYKDNPNSVAVDIALKNGITETEKPKTKTTKKPKTEIEEKYEKIDFKF